MDDNTRRAIQYILNGSYKYPDDSLVDIANEAFNDFELDYFAEWDNDIEAENPITIGPYIGWEIIKDE